MSTYNATYIREQLGHPVVDADSHLIESLPVLFDYLKAVGGPSMAERAWDSFCRRHSRAWYDLDADGRRYHNEMRPSFWAAPAENTLDRATAMLPRLMAERLQEFGIDFAIIYPTLGFLMPDLPETEIRQAACRAQNLLMRDLFRGLEYRLTPAAVIPCWTPEEAIGELRHCVTELGFKVAMFGNLVRRPIGAVADKDPSLASYAYWVDTLALDSQYDYDPLWATCVELSVPVCSHAIGQGLGIRRSHSNWMFNNTGHFADAANGFARALFFGGVTHRFPDLNVAFLECGAAWAAALLDDLRERWEKRNGTAVQQYNPARVDYGLLNYLFTRYGGDVLSNRVQRASMSRNPATDSVDDFALTGISSVNDLYDRFVPNFYYGCAPDDRVSSIAFDRNLLGHGIKLNGMFSSDLGHWDVTDMRQVLRQSMRLLNDNLLTSDDFRDFAYRHAMSLFTTMNPDFFVGTALETYAVNSARRNAYGRFQ